MIIYSSFNLDFFLLWMLFLALIGFSIWVYFYARWNVIGGKWKARAKNLFTFKKRKVKEAVEIEKLDRALNEEGEDKSAQELLRLQSEKDKLEKQQELKEKERVFQEQEKAKDLEIKKALKAERKKQKGKDNQSAFETEKSIENLELEAKKPKSDLTIEMFAFEKKS